LQAIWSDWEVTLRSPQRVEQSAGRLRGGSSRKGQCVHPVRLVLWLRARDVVHRRLDEEATGLPLRLLVVVPNAHGPCGGAPVHPSLAGHGRPWKGRPSWAGDGRVAGGESAPRAEHSALTSPSTDADADPPSPRKISRQTACCHDKSTLPSEAGPLQKIVSQPPPALAQVVVHAWQRQSFRSANKKNPSAQAIVH
jgi:hypothetical protein